MWKNLPWERLQRDTVPHLCAKTGVPTETLRKQYLVQRQKASGWAYLFFGLIWPWIWGWVFAYRTSVWLPIAPRVLWRHRAMRLACLAYPFVAVKALMALLPNDTIAFWLAVVGFVLLVRATHRAWVQPRWHGVVRLRDPHQKFVDAVRNTVLIRQEDGALVVHEVPVVVPPGWYADPSGEHAHRYWNGGAWTEHVMGTSA